MVRWAGGAAEYCFRPLMLSVGSSTGSIVAIIILLTRFMQKNLIQRLLTVRDISERWRRAT